MSKTYKVIVALIVIAVVGYGGWRVYQWRRATKAGLLSENIVHNGNDWTADFTAMIPAPEESVYDAVRDIEKTHSDQIRNVTVISQNGNSKTVELEMNGPGGQPIKMQMVFAYNPAAHRISYHTVDNPAMQTDAVYNFEDQGSSTLITCHQKTTMTQQLPVPDSVVKDVIRGIFVSQLESLKRALNITTPDEAEENDEP